MRQNLVKELNAFQEGKISLDDLELWLVGHLQQILRGDDSELREQADRLDALLIQFGEGVISPTELNEEIEGALRNLLTILVPTTDPAEAVSIATDDNETHKFSAILQEANQDLVLPMQRVA